MSYSAGACLKNRRLECGLTYREVERLTRDLAAKYRDTGYIVRISVLADIENQGTVPSLFRLKSLCMIYSLELEAVLSWYGLPSGPEPAATLDQEPVASRRLERPVSPAPVSLIFFITCCFLAIGIGVLVVRQFTGSDAWVVEYFQMPVAQIMICFAAVQVWYGNTMARKVAWGALHQIAWTVITCSAVCQLIGLLLSQILGVSSRLNPLVLQSGPLSALIPELWRLGLTIGGPLRFALLSIGFGLILKAHPERRLRRFKPLDWTVFSLLALYIARNVADVVVAILGGKHPDLLEMLNWPTDPLLVVLLGQTILLYRLAPEGEDEMVWRAFGLGVFLTIIGDVGKWAFDYGYLPTALFSLTWTVWLPASAAFACAPGYWMSEHAPAGSLQAIRADTGVSAGNQRS